MYLTELLHSSLSLMNEKRKNEWKERYDREFQNLTSMQLIECNELY